MKPRARRIALVTVSAGCLVVAAFVICNSATVRDHWDALWFIWRNETVELQPFAGTDSRCQHLADQSGLPVIMLASIADFGGRTPTSAFRGKHWTWRAIKLSFPRPVYVEVGRPMLPGEIEEMERQVQAARTAQASGGQ